MPLPRAGGCLKPGQARPAFRRCSGKTPLESAPAVLARFLLSKDRTRGSKGFREALGSRTPASVAPRLLISWVAELDVLQPAAKAAGQDSPGPHQPVEFTCNGPADRSAGPLFSRVVRCSSVLQRRARSLVVLLGGSRLGRRNGARRRRR